MRLEQTIHPLQMEIITADNPDSKKAGRPAII